MNYVVLSREELADELQALGPQWSGSVDLILRSWSLESFEEAMTLANRIAALCVQQSHHLDLLIRRRRVIAELRTNAAGGVTAEDITLARGLNELM